MLNNFTHFSATHPHLASELMANHQLMSYPFHLQMQATLTSFSIEALYTEPS